MFPIEAAVEEDLLEPPTTVPTTPPRLRRSGPWFLAACLVCGLAASFLLYPRLRPEAAPARSIVGPPLRPRLFGFLVHPQANQLLLSWDSNSVAVRNATRAVLTITDGGREEDVDLYLPQFRTGSVMYEPVTDDVQFRLTVTSGVAGQASEYARVSGWSRETARPLEVASAAPPIPMGELAVTSTPPPGVRPFARPSPATQPPENATVLEPPTLEASTRGPQGELDPALGTRTLPAPPAAPARPVEVRTTTSSVAPPAPAVQVPAGPMRVKSLRVIRSTAILYPPAARQARVSGTVTVEVRIGVDGKVLEAAAINGPEMLRWIAARGVKEWLFEPAQVAGRTVEAITRVDVTFVP